MLLQHVKHPTLEAKKREMRFRIPGQRGNVASKSYRQIIEHHFNIHSRLVLDAEKEDAGEFLKIHIIPKTKMAHKLIKVLNVTHIRRRDLGSFSHSLSRTLDSLEAHLKDTF